MSTTKVFQVSEIENIEICKLKWFRHVVSVRISVNWKTATERTEVALIPPTLPLLTTEEYLPELKTTSRTVASVFAAVKIRRKTMAAV